MQKQLFIGGIVVLLVVSSIGNATLYINGRDKNDNMPQGDCLEMNCPSGICWGDENFHGDCCASEGKTGQSCRFDGKDIGGCCESGVCKDGKCVAASTQCTYNGKNYKAGARVGECGKCENGVIVIDQSVSIFECKKCNTLEGADQWKIISKEDDTPAVDACQICKKGSPTYKDKGKTVSCGAGAEALCCQTGYQCSQDAQGKPLCVASCKNLGKISKREINGNVTGYCPGSGSSTHAKKTIIVNETVTPTSNMVLETGDLCVINGDSSDYAFNIYDQTMGQYLPEPVLVKRNCIVAGKHCHAFNNAHSGQASYELLAGHIYSIDISYVTPCDAKVTLNCQE